VLILAQRAATAAKETLGKIDNAIQKSNAGVIITTKVKGSLHQIVDKARQVDQLIVEIATASKEQSSGIQQVNVGVSQIHYGLGLRVYYKQRGSELVILLAGGDKGSQS
jgi:putative addiction module killer protein